MEQSHTEQRRASTVELVDQCVARTNELCRKMCELFGDPEVNRAVSIQWAKGHRDLYTRVMGHEPGMRTRRRWWCFWQRRVPVVVPESLIRGALYSARINAAINWNAELRRRREGATA